MINNVKFLGSRKICTSDRIEESRIQFEQYKFILERRWSCLINCKVGWAASSFSATRTESCRWFWHQLFLERLRQFFSFAERLYSTRFYFALKQWVMQFVSHFLLYETGTIGDYSSVYKSNSEMVIVIVSALRILIRLPLWI